MSNTLKYPVVGVSWYTARSYCFWLSCLDAALTGDRQLLDGDINQLASIYRLPREEEWEWMENYFSESEEYMALRGGSYSSFEGFLVCSSRFLSFPDYEWDFDIGFRVVRSLPPVI